jgi:hypothetical protein
MRQASLPEWIIRSTADSVTFEVKQWTCNSEIKW